MKSSMIAIMLSVICHAHAMEMVKKNPSIPCNDICYLNQMPRDILNYIASFLMETEEKFVARTRVKKDLGVMEQNIQEYCCNVLIKHGFFSTDIAFCPDEIKVLFFGRRREFLDNGDKVNVDNIIIIDRQKNNDSDNVIYQQKLDDRDKYDCIALSSSGSMIATLYRKYSSEYNMGAELCWTNVVEIQKVDTQKKVAMHFCGTLSPHGIFFNKQGTHLIMHGEEQYTGKGITHKIILLKAMHADQSQVLPNITNQLQLYLKDKFVCDRYIEGKK
jgi:hypothetical protein